METDNLKIDIDMAEFHGLSVSGDNTDNPYRPPSSSDLNPFLSYSYVELGFWSYLAIIIVVVWFSFVNYILISALAMNGIGATGFIIFMIFLVSIIALSHLLILFKVELARKIVVIHAYFLLLGIPVGTIIGIILLKGLKGKRFAKKYKQKD